MTPEQVNFSDAWTRPKDSKSFHTYPLLAVGEVWVVAQLIVRAALALYPLVLVPALLQGTRLLRIRRKHVHDYLE